VEFLLAQTHAPSGDGGSLALTIIALVAMLVPMVVLAWVCWIFWKAKKRDEAEERATEWRNAHSS
jgi:heme/copper-type cytochrome/quinol oxidase subunit 2